MTQVLQSPELFTAVDPTQVPVARRRDVAAHLFACAIDLDGRGEPQASTAATFLLEALCSVDTALTDGTELYDPIALIDMAGQSNTDKFIGDVLATLPTALSQQAYYGSPDAQIAVTTFDVRAHTMRGEPYSLRFVHSKRVLSDELSTMSGLPTHESVFGVTGTPGSGAGCGALDPGFGFNVGQEEGYEDFEV